MFQLAAGPAPERWAGQPCNVEQENKKMKFKSIRKWKYSPELEGLLLFAQRLDELLFDFTLDTYKPPALNSAFLCLEALQLITEIEAETIEKANLKHVLDELEWSLRHDEVAKELINLEIKDYVLRGENDNINSVKVRLELLFNCINPAKYLNKTYELIFDSVRKNEKKRISYLAKTMTTSLLNIGYHQTFLYNKILEFFFYDDIEISNVNDLNKLISQFTLEDKEYEVVFRVSKLIREITDSCEAFNLKIIESLPDEYVLGKNKFSKTSDEVYLMKIKVTAYDPFSARESAERSLEKTKNLFVLFHHKKGIKWNDEALVFCKTTKKEFLLKRPVGAMKKGFDLKAEKAAKELNNFIKNFQLSSRSFEKFDRVVDFHGLAISNEIVENQLINLWTSLETIIPSHSGKNKITNIISSLVPFLMLAYTQRLLQRLLSDLILWNHNIVKGIMRKIPDSKGLTLIEKTALLVALPETKPLREELYSKFADYSLLRNRVFNLSELLGNADKLSAKIKEHQTKVEWQIRRIYRTRNLIVHSGKTPPYSNVLIENIHTYLDLLLETIFNYSMNDENVLTIEQSVELAKLRYEKYLKLLSESKGNITRDTIKKMLMP